MRISDWSSDVCSSDLFLTLPVPVSLHRGVNAQFDNRAAWIIGGELHIPCDRALNRHQRGPVDDPDGRREARLDDALPSLHRSEEHTSELQSLMRLSYAVFCLKNKTHPIYPLHTANKQTHNK